MARQPNILWIVVDALRADHLGCYGYDRQTSPCIDRLASQGVLYRRAFSQADYSLPSYTTMLTGLYPHEHGVGRTVSEQLDEAVPTLACQLSRIGYETVCLTSNAFIGQSYGLHRGFTHHSYTWRHPKGPYKLLPWLLRTAGLLDQGTKKSVRLTKQLVRNCTKPWFVFLVCMETHRPYKPPWGFIGKFQSGLLTPITHPYFTWWSKNALRVACTATPEQLERVRALYDAQIAYSDYCIGALTEFLAQQKVLNDTIIIITADHGEFMGERGLHGHEFGLGEALVHVPLIIHYPPGMASGKVDDRIVELRDIPYTIMDLVGTPLESFSAYSARNLLAHSPHDRPFAYAQRGRGSPEKRPEQHRKKKWVRRFLERGYDRHIQLLRTPRWEFKLYGNGDRALYEIERDPAEQDNIAEQKSDIVDELERMLADFVAQASPVPSSRDKSEPATAYTEEEQEMVKERLRDLGYL